ncbi:MAG: A24 family peptidase [Acidimicrobiia bacterium]|nr:A24 family peptidase [Acidimicrobiia bacterium]
MMLIVAGLAILGLLLGPSLGIVVDRAVDRLRPAAEHRCVHCQHPQGPGSLIPVVGWFRTCQGCDRYTGWRYPAVDVTTAIVFGLLGVRFVDDGSIDWKLWPYLALGAVLVVLSVIDIETHLLPNVLVWPAIGVSLFLVFVVSGELGDGDAITAALLGGAIFGGFIGAAHLVHEQGMGRGDVKLALLLGLFVGWVETDLFVVTRLVLYALFLALLGGGLVGLAVNAIRRRGRAEIPFGPALAAGSLAIILVSPAIAGTGP